jgi:hypothetical protein
MFFIGTKLGAGFRIAKNLITQQPHTWNALQTRKSEWLELLPLKNLKYLLIFILLAALMTLVTIWLAINNIFFTFVFSVASVGYPENWIYVAVNFLLLSLFLVFIAFRRRAARLPSSIYLAFIVALYIEMYGFPLTMYAISAVFRFNRVATLCSYCHHLPE